MDIFNINLLEICFVCLKRPKINEKEADIIKQTKHNYIVVYQQLSNPDKYFVGCLGMNPQENLYT